ncbi:ceramide-1-phosphate transfer protein-like [Leucoraja erinacea]|uniref:ceramide-1-phosphate transfer protein-like n=1 Tax=Leucoraja erinaceus TaxID=7782 RepID=UPI0024544527|nr:ceramide-1-phosphate transfer protein-like [Leucoraja erinacea]
MVVRKLQLMKKQARVGNRGKTRRLLLAGVVVLIPLLIYLINTNLSQFPPLNPWISVHEDGQRDDHQHRAENPVAQGSTQQCSNNFQIHRLQAAFHASVTKDEDISLKSYLEGWTELQKFMKALGSVFGFISDELSNKMKIIYQYQHGATGKAYSTVKSMIEFELRNDQVNFSELGGERLESGSRTLLRLHRALQWLQLFLGQLRSSHENSSMYQMCADAYWRSLGKHHSWLVRQAAALAFLALPTRAEFLHILCMRDGVESKAQLHSSVLAIERVYNITQHLYAQHRMLELP